MPVFIVITLQHDGKFIAADPVDRTVFINTADETAAGADTLIAEIVSMMVVDQLQIVNIADNNGKRAGNA